MQIEFNKFTTICKKFSQNNLTLTGVATASKWTTDVDATDKNRQVKPKSGQRWLNTNAAVSFFGSYNHSLTEEPTTWQHLTSAPESDFPDHKRFLEMENKQLVVEFWINLSPWDHDYWLTQPISWCHCSEDRVGNVLNRQDILKAHNSDFQSRFQNDSNMQMRLGK